MTRAFINRTSLIEYGPDIGIVQIPQIFLILFPNPYSNAVKSKGMDEGLLRSPKGLVQSPCPAKIPSIKGEFFEPSERMMHQALSNGFKNLGSEYLRYYLCQVILYIHGR